MDWTTINMTIIYSLSFHDNRQSETYFQWVLDLVRGCVGKGPCQLASWRRQSPRWLKGEKISRLFFWTSRRENNSHWRCYFIFIHYPSRSFHIHTNRYNYRRYSFFKRKTLCHLCFSISAVCYNHKQKNQIQNTARVKFWRFRNLLISFSNHVLKLIDIDFLIVIST